jgi:hypothetical protein
MIYDILSSSHVYFISQKQIVFRNMTAHYHFMKTDDDDFVKLSDFANWWNNYDFDNHNWFFDEDVANAKKTFDLVKNEFDQEISFDYERIASFYNRLYFLNFDEFIYL